ncbi:hypothetical protein ASG31_08345 [Chryseobacterium sp. Leaf404]|uniref:hypothetical protein n=1 Tax=unclassified Chryseobacterium TaxID=2593645 RepID=UPI0007018E8A|nr:MULTISPECIES: hypothetical protein [unclassified Chryseobacterium]KQT17411.1 hypothetical protein ASG31_08345 [Chryseobacterium sp. Leaf404]
MDNFFANFLLDFQNRITEKVPEIKYIDQDLGQLGQDSEDERPPLVYPAILIDFPSTDYTNISGGAQVGAVQISIQLIFAPFSQSWQKAPQPVKEKALEYLAIEQKVHKALQNWEADYFQALVRTNIRSQNNNDIGLRVRNLNYTTQYEDYSPIDEEFKEIEFTFKGNLNTN